MMSVLKTLGLSLAVMIGLQGAALAERRVALVIGNGAYVNAPVLANPPRDAHAMADKLKAMGFQVVEGYDVSREGMNSKIQQFARAVIGADVGLFYYAGHGMQVGGDNYIVPVDARLADAMAVDFEITKANFVIDQMSRDVKLKIAFLDSCRDNPMSRSLAVKSRSNAISIGMAPMQIINQSASEGSLIAFATDPGNTAADGSGEHSPFTTALLENIDKPLPLSSIMNRVTSSVLKQTQNVQRPWISASLTGDVYLAPGASPVATDATAPEAPAPLAAAPAPTQADDAASQARETALWDAVKQASTIEDYQAYLSTYPSGLYSGLARNAINRLQAKVAADTPAPAVAPAPVAQAPVAAFPAPATPAPVAPAQPAQQQVAALQPAQPQPTRAAPAFGDVQDVTQAPSSPETEFALALTPAAQKAMLQRLRLAGFDPGKTDAKFRVALTRWQTARGIQSTGFLNQPQYALLLSETDEAYNTWKAAQAAPKPRPQVRQQQFVEEGEPQQVVRRRPRPQGGGTDPGAAAFFGGLVGGALGGFIARH